MLQRLSILLIILINYMPLCGQVSVGASMGGVISTPKGHVTDRTLQLTIPAERRASVTAALHGDVPLGESGLRLMPALRYAQKGFLAHTEVVVQQTKVTIDLSHRMTFIELGIPLGFAVGVGEHNLVAGIGPYGAMAMGGAVKTIVSLNGITDERKESVVFGSGAGQFDRLDYGFEATAGMVFSNGILLHLRYALGIPNLSNDPANPLRQRSASLSVGYFFLR